jgi:hypothetical protein
MPFDSGPIARLREHRPSRIFYPIPIKYIFRLCDPLILHICRQEGGFLTSIPVWILPCLTIRQIVEQIVPF